MPKVSHRLGLLTALVVAGCGGGDSYSGPSAGPEPAQGAGAGPRPDLGTIAFVSTRGGRTGVFVMRPDGSGQSRVADLGEASEFLVVPPDAVSLDPEGGRVAFACALFEACVVNRDGSRLTGLGSFSLMDPDPDIPGSAIIQMLFSPDGARLAVRLAADDADGELGLLRVGECPQDPDDCPRADAEHRTMPHVDVLAFDFAPDSKTLAFSGSGSDDPEDEGLFGVLLLDLATSRLTRVTDHFGRELAFSPDGVRIAFVDERVNEDTGLTDQDIFVVNRDGTGLTQLTHTRRPESAPRWSPDGSKLAFVRSSEGIEGYPDAGTEIYVLDLATGREVNASNSEADDFGPVWSPDGQWLAFTSDRDDDLEVYAVRADGTGLTRLTISPGLDAVSDWR
jgi:hypothetical protein